MRLRLFERPWVAVAVAVALFFVANRGAYEGFFSDDDLDNLGWTTIIGWDVYRDGLLTPFFSYDNFRPAGHVFYRLMHGLAGFAFARWVLALQALHLLNVFLVYRLGVALGVQTRGAAAGALVFAFHPALFAAFWKPMYVFDLTCATFLLASGLLYLRDRLVASLVAFWLAYKAKEVAVFFPCALLLVEAGRGRRWWRLAPFFAISLNFGLQAMLANRVRNSDYTLNFAPEAWAKTVRFYGGQIGLVVAAAAALAWRDRRFWLALAAAVAMVGPLWFLPGRMFAVYLYVPMIALAAAVGWAAERVAWRWLALAAAGWLAFVYLVDLRAFRRAELTAGRENRTFFERVCAMKGEVEPRGTYLYEGGPRFMNTWGVEGAYHLCFSPEMKLVLLNPHEANWKSAANQVLSWNAPRAELRVIRPERSAAMQVLQLERGWHALNWGVRWSSENPQARIWQEPGADEFQIEVHPTTTQIAQFGKMQVVIHLDGQWIGDAQIDRAGPYVRSWPVAPVPAGRWRVVDFQVTPYHTVPGSPHRYGIPFADFRLQKRKP